MVKNKVSVMSKTMWHLFCAILWLFSASTMAGDDLFADGQVEDIPMEFDPDFKDDFGDIEQSDASSNAPGMIIADSYSLWSSRDLWRREKSLSFMGGNETIASTYHFLVFPQGRFEFLKVFGHVGVPLRFPVYDNVKFGTSGRRSRGFVSGEKFITPRRQDFRNFFDVQRVFRHMEIGGSYEPYFFRLSRIHSLTMGQGELIKDMNPDGLYDHDIMFFYGQMSFDNVRIAGFLGPIVQAQMFGLSARFTPLYNLDVPPFVRDLNFDLTYVNDFLAPNMAKKQDGAFVLDNERRLVERETGSAQGLSLGVAGEYFALPWLSLKPYTALGNLWLTGLRVPDAELSTRYGAGLHVGHDATVFFVPGTKRSVLLMKTEARIFSSRYWPGYFGSTYLIDRVVQNEPENTNISPDPMTKSQFLGQRQDGHARIGYLFELAYAYEKVITGAIGYENARSFLLGNQIEPMRKLHFILGFLGLDLVKFHLGYQATSIAQMKEVFDFEKSRALLSLRGQLKLAPFLYFDAWAKHSFGISDMFTPSDEENGNAMWLSNQAETRSLNFGLGLEFAMTF